MADITNTSAAPAGWQWQDTLKKNLFGTEPGMQQVSPYTPQQQAATSTILNQGLQQIQAPSDFSGIENEYKRQFNEETVPGIANYFGGSQRGSAFQNALGSAGSGLNSQLAALRANYGLQQQQMGQNLLRLGLQPQHENINTPGTQGYFQTAGPEAISRLLSGESKDTSWWQQLLDAASAGGNVGGIAGPVGGLIGAGAGALGQGAKLLWDKYVGGQKAAPNAASISNKLAAFRALQKGNKNG